MKTMEYIKSLQVGSMGFAETTGENPWTDKSNLAIQMFDWFDIPIENKKELVVFFQDFQNGDGGFGSLAHESSSFHNTSETVFILNKLGSEPRDVGQTIQWLKNNFNLKNPWEAFNYIQTLVLLDHIFDKEEKNELSNHISDFLNNLGLDYENKYYCVKSLLLLGQSIESYNKTINNKNIIKNNAKENYYLSKLLSIYNKIENLKDEFYFYTIKNELKQGGFSSPEISIIQNGFMMHSLYLMDHLNVINKDKFVQWLLSVSNEDGWGSTQHSPQYHEYTVTSLLALKLCGLDNIKNKDGIIRKTEEELNNALNFSHRNNYHVLRTIKNSLERLMLLNVQPANLLKIINKVMEYYDKGGGFGPKKKSYLYATFWAIRSLYLSEKYLKYSRKVFISKLNKIKDKTTNWINSCQNADGGFGPMPNQTSNIQSTFCAHYSLWMLGKKPKDIEKAIEWLLGLQKSDGGFAGSKETESEMLHVLYVMGSLVIMGNIL